jgi:Sulfotransferase family
MSKPVRPNFLPNFLIVGTGKAGTTSLYHYLRQHPQIFMSEIKEPCYFASEVRIENLAPSHLRHIRRQARKVQRPAEWIISKWDDYVKLFENVESQTAVGEASVVYLWSRTAPENIASRIPGAKIVMILRDPVNRAFSQYLHQLSVGLIRCTFREHVEKAMRRNDQKITAYNPFLEVGLYYQQVKRYFDRFPKENIRIYWFEEAWREPERLFADLFQFLGVDAAFRPDMSQRSLERKAPRLATLNYVAKRFDLTHRLRDAVPSGLRKSLSSVLFRRGRSVAIDPKDRKYLIDYYREDIVNLAAFLNRDLSAWLR